MMHERYQPDAHLFETHECAECHGLGKEIAGMIYDDDRNKYFCDDDCRLAFIQSEAEHLMEADR